MVRRARAWGRLPRWGLVVAMGSASACNPDTSGLGSSTAEPVDPSSTGAATSMGSTTGPTNPPADSTTSTGLDDAATTTSTSTGDPPTLDGSTSSSSGDASDTETPPTMVELCAMPDVAIPDASAGGVASMIDVPDDGTVVDLHVVVRADHTYVGDLTFELSKGEASLLLIDRPGMAPPAHCSGDDLDVVLRDDAPTTIDAACNPDPAVSPALFGDVQPDNPIAPVFIDKPMMGTWRLHAVDHATMDHGRFIEWCLQITYQ